MIDFSGLQRKNKTYNGANGNKISVVYNGNVYMLKFPPLPTKNKDMSYTNSCISEYIGCKIFQSVGIPVQETLLGTYMVNDKKKVVVACKDFTSFGVILQDFASLKNQMINSERNGYGTELSDVVATIATQSAVDEKVLNERFWDMFIVDAFIGNWDRHNGNWGFLYDERTDTQTLAPVYDCGSSLFPQADEELMLRILHNKQELQYRVYETPTSAITQDFKRINYFRFISSLENSDCNAALQRICPKINLQKIERIIDDVSCISNLQKQFYKTMLRERKEKILDYSLKLFKMHSRECGVISFQHNGESKDISYRDLEERIFGSGRAILNYDNNLSHNDLETHPITNVVEERSSEEER